MFLVTIVLIAATTTIAVGKSHNNKRIDRMANNMLKAMANAEKRTEALAPKYFPNQTSPIPTPNNSSMLENMSKSANMTLK